jgi:hypothetical protein
LQSALNLGVARALAEEIRIATKVPDRRESRRVNAVLECGAHAAGYQVNTLAITPAEFRTWIIEDIQKWAKVVKFAGIKSERPSRTLIPSPTKNFF